jgi:DNA-binding MarR family transcriptional regulator
MQIDSVSSYLEDTLGTKPEFTLRKAPSKLQFLLAQLYEFYEVTLYGITVLAAISRSDDRLTPAEITRHAVAIQDSFSKTPVFILPGFSSWDRKRLIASHVSFIVPGTQLFLPFSGIDLRERYAGPKVNIDKLLPVAQFLILFHLQKEVLDGYSVRELARKFGYSPSAISRAVIQLISLGLASAEPGKKKLLSFRYQSVELWQKALPYLSSPVLRTLPIAKSEIPLSCTASGLSALSVLTSLDEGPIKYCSISAAELRNLPVLLDYKDKFDPDADRLEIWSYSPKPLAADGLADPLSLSLEFADETDERVRKAVDDLLKERFKW